MNSVTIDWVRDWALQRNVIIAVERLLSLAYEDSAPQNRVTVLTEPERTPGSLVLLANRLVWVEPEEDTEVLSDQDRQYFFWVRENGIWTDMMEALASEAFGALFRAHGLSTDTQGCSIPENESRTAVLLALNAILFGWDAYLAPLSGRFLCHISHDGYIDLRAPEEALLRVLLLRFESWGAEMRPIQG